MLEILKTTGETLPQFWQIALMAAPALSAVLLDCGVRAKIIKLYTTFYGHGYPDGEHDQPVARYGNPEDNQVIVPSGGKGKVLIKLPEEKFYLITILDQRVAQKRGPNQGTTARIIVDHNRQEVFNRQLDTVGRPVNILPDVTVTKMLTNQERLILDNFS